MTIRTIRQTVTFARPFTLAHWDEAQPAGTYEIEIDEELLEGFSCSAYRRVQTLFHLHPARRNPGLRQTILISGGELEAALQRDQAPAPGAAGPVQDRHKTPNGKANSGWAADADRPATGRGEDEGMILRFAPIKGQQSPE